MIARLIAWSARNLMLVLIATAFAIVGGIWALRNLPLDAIPDLSDTQVIIYTQFPGQAPQVVEDQVTYLQCLDHADQGPHRHALTGIRTPVGVEVIGKDLVEMEKIAREVEKALKTVHGTASAYAERIVGGYYLEIIPDRDRLARHGLMVSEVQDVIATALGAEPITTTVEGRERYTVAIRYPRDLRYDPQSIAFRCVMAWHRWR